MLMNWTDQAVHKWETSQKKSYYSILTLTNLKYCMSYTTKLHMKFWAGNKKSSPNKFLKGLDHIYRKLASPGKI